MGSKGRALSVAPIGAIEEIEELEMGEIEADENIWWVGAVAVEDEADDGYMKMKKKTNVDANEMADFKSYDNEMADFKMADFKSDEDEMADFKSK